MIHIYITNIKDRVPSDFQSVTGQPFSQNDKFSQQRRDDARNKLKKLSTGERTMLREVNQREARDREVAAEAERRASANWRQKSTSVMKIRTPMSHSLWICRQGTFIAIS